MSYVEKEKKSNFVVVGLGSFGIYHLESVLTNDYQGVCFGVDTDKNRISHAQSKFIKSKNLILTDKIMDLPKEIDLAIVATTSEFRDKISLELISGRKIHNIILEKVLAQSKEQLMTLLKLNKFIPNVYVNYSRREMANYIQVVESIKRIKIKNNITITVKSSNFELLSNIFHYIDLVDWISPSAICDIEFKDVEFIESKRKNFINLYGQVTIKFSNNNYLKIYNYRDNSNYINVLNIEILHKNMKLYEIENELNLLDNQSNLTYKYIVKILNGSSLNLPKIERVAKNEILLLESMAKLVKDELKISNNKIKIT